ncbi:MAG: hypothetical protein E6I45_00205 [Chloroflexi bacterium]|nr:MAG: hypothetical protein E6I45_00205 [Chloroflexota bacterium]
MKSHTARLGAAIAVAVAVGLLATAPVAAHVVEHAGPYTLEIGWQNEPTYVGAPNGVQVIVHDASDKPVNDLKTDDLKVVVSTGGKQSDELTFDPAFDLEEGFGTPGEYNAAIVPTAPGDYTFHVTGTIKSTKVDISVTSSEETFDTVKGTSDIEFPTKLPTLPEIVTRLDRIDARIATPSGAPTQAAVDAADAHAADARAAADRALAVGVVLGGIGVVLGAAALFVAIRGTRRSPA